MLIAPFPDLCLLVPLYMLFHITNICVLLSVFVNVTEIGVSSQVSTDMYGVPVALHMGTS